MQLRWWRNSDDSKCGVPLGDSLQFVTKTVWHETTAHVNPSLITELGPLQFAPHVKRE